MSHPPRVSTSPSYSPSLISFSTPPQGGSCGSGGGGNTGEGKEKKKNLLFGIHIFLYIGGERDEEAAAAAALRESAGGGLIFSSFEIALLFSFLSIWPVVLSWGW